MKLETKVQLEALKLLEKGIEPKYAESSDGKKIYITLNGFWAICIDKDKLWLDKEKIKPMPSISDFFDDTKILDASELKISNTLHRLPNDEIGDILSGNGFDICIKSKYSKLLHKNDCEMYAKDKNSAVYFVLDGEIYAIVMPINMHEE